MDNYILTDDAIKKIENALKIIEKLTSDTHVFLTPQEKKKLCWVNQNNKMITKKTIIYNKTNPKLSSPDINWEKLDSDSKKSEALIKILEKIKILNEGISGAILKQDWLNYKEALIDYNYTKYKAKSLKEDIDFFNKMEDLSQHFSRKV
ncbi:hypothetical protein [Flavobacterium sp.]|jgi:hypothetical protein|uniref:hypothetical protein n=1 Tax=Flavobacterium sp. TaxID=239 RepID=UPI0037BF389D